MTVIWIWPIVALGLGVALGFWGCRLYSWAQPEPTTVLATPQAANVGIASLPPNITNPVDWVQSIHWAQPDASALQAAAPVLSKQPALVDALLARFGSESNETAKLNLLRFLTDSPTEYLLTQATAWAADRADVDKYRNGMQLLSFLPPTPQAVHIARQALDQTADPQILSFALMAFRPEEPFNPQEVLVRLPQFHALTQHPLAVVRTHSIQRLAEWDRAEQYLVADVMRLLNDPDHETRIAAIGATSIAGLKGAELRKRLLAILSDPQEDPELRSVAHMQMSRFAFTPEEYETYTSATNQLIEGAATQKP